MLRRSPTNTQSSSQHRKAIHARLCNKQISYKQTVFFPPSVGPTSPRSLPSITLLRATSRSFLPSSFDAGRPRWTVRGRRSIQSTSLWRSASTSSALCNLCTLPTTPCLINLSPAASTHRRSTSHGWKRRNPLSSITGLRRLHVVSGVLR